MVDACLAVQDMRTQISINTVWRQRVRCRKVFMLILWLVALVLCLYVAVDETGRNEMCALRHVHRGKPRACGCGVPGVGCACSRVTWSQMCKHSISSSNWRLWRRIGERRTNKFSPTYRMGAWAIELTCIAPCLTHSLLQRRHVVVA